MNSVRGSAIVLLHNVQLEPHPIVEALIILSELFKRKGVNPEDPKYRGKI
ncbi:hypothetical protein [Thermotoga sp.]|nr:hypothetical protein [Thermotoga sp.]